jgi:hypothetical protein
VLVFVLLAGGFTVLRHCYPWDPATKWVDPAWPVGIRGWLIPFAILIALAVISWPFSLWLHAGDLDVSTWGKLPGSTRAVLLWFAVVGVLIEVALILTALLFFTRRSSAPALVIGTRSAEVLWALALQLYEAASPLLAKQSVGYVLSHDWPAFVGLALYIGYFSQSKRVKATFVTRYQPRGRHLASVRPAAGAANPT